MKIRTTVTEIEASADELRQSNSLADSVLTCIRGMFNPVIYSGRSEDDDDDEDGSATEA